MVFKSVVSPESSVQQSRFYALDAARAIALLLGIIYHGMESFVTYTPQRAYATRDTETSAVLDFLFFACHTFRMQAFFLIAGFFAHQLYHRRGAGGFLEHRFKRIVLPLVLFWPILCYLLKTGWIWGHQQLGYYEVESSLAHTSPWSIAASELLSLRWFKMEGLTFPLFHLWFLYYLILFCACTVIIRPLVARFLDRSGAIRQHLDYLLRLSMTKWWGGIVVGLLIALPMCRMKLLFGVDVPNQNLVPNTRPFVVYGLFFFLGWLFHRQSDLLQRMKEYRLSNLTIYVLLIAGLYTYFLYRSEAEILAAGQLAETKTMDYVYRAIYGIASTVAVFTLLGYMMALFSKANTRIRYLADASYWMYLAHFPLVVAMQILVSSFAWPWFLKVAVIVSSSLSILLLSYHYLVRSTWIGVLLNGKKYSR